MTHEHTGSQAETVLELYGRFLLLLQGAWVGFPTLKWEVTVACDSCSKRPHSCPFTLLPSTNTRHTHGGAPCGAVTHRQANTHNTNYKNEETRMMVTHCNSKNLKQEDHFETSIGYTEPKASPSYILRSSLKGKKKL